MLTRKQSMLYGAVLGAWFGLVYAFWSQAINWLFLPGISLAAPQDNLGQYVFGFVVMGLLLGAVSSIPSSTFAGVTLGGFVSALVISAIGLVTPSAGESTIWRKLILFFYTFLPLVVLLMPLAYIIRAGVNAQLEDPNRPYLWARRYLVVGLITIGVLVVASFSLYDRQTRQAFYFMNDLVKEAQTAGSAQQLPETLQTVQGYWENARGAYRLAWSDDIEAFMGPQPVGLETSQFIIVARFQNGFAFACIFQPGGTYAPFCTNF
jgi:hypothetical protein